MIATLAFFFFKSLWYTLIKSQKNIVVALFKTLKRPHVITKSRSPSPNLGFPRLNKAHLKGLTHEGEDTNGGASSPWPMLNP
jgi:hypothetical protein